jgi:hypothetical protein
MFRAWLTDQMDQGTFVGELIECLMWLGLLWVCYRVF